MTAFGLANRRLSYFMGVVQGLLLCEAGGVGLDAFSSTVPVDARAGMIAKTIQSNTFNDPVITVEEKDFAALIKIFR